MRAEAPAGLPFVTDLLQTTPIFRLKLDLGVGLKTRRGRPQNKDQNVFEETGQYLSLAGDPRERMGADRLHRITTTVAGRAAFGPSLSVSHEVRSKSMSGYVSRRHMTMDVRSSPAQPARKPSLHLDSVLDLSS